MNKKYLHHAWTKVRKVSYYYLLIACLVSGLVTVLALRQNNLTALALRDKVLQVDKDNGDTEKALKTLRSYVYSHMNTDLSSDTSVYPPIQLKYRYDRLVAAEKAKFDQTNTNTIYADAQKYCETTQPESFYGAGRLGCIQSYIDTNPATAAETPVSIPDSLYKYDFASPLWSPDAAGISLLFFLLFLVLFIIRYLLERWFRFELKQRL